VQFAIGYSEPQAGSDLAALKTTAVREGDHYVVNGTKIFTSGADEADYIWLAARTDADAARHKGISILIVDTKLPGFSSSPIHTVNGGHTSMSYYENVRVPANMLVGKENGGWRLITLQLNHERIGLAAFGNAVVRAFEDAQLGARDARRDGRRRREAWVRRRSPESFARLEALKVLNWRMAWRSAAASPRRRAPRPPRSTAPRS
jgi:alkylation response protein AidB-like acyl-CoA dehydrogenase